MTWTPRTLHTLDERERAAYADGDTDAAALCVQAADGDAGTGADLAQARAILADWGEEMLEPIRLYVTDMDDNAELLAIIRRVQDELYDRVLALENALC